ncbi:hypothetical protein GGR21_003747 [Dysgonomonas hofstadii]|uniref:Beta-carotene 15,15'-monooxygenase n=1 Tax=Dysgonomonas hofstadii TaxID=637886 RepID=A0A840CQX5_9BACT|nr:hypothetical protein [Dysgonomonas hofstadii]MBB4037826.1 hypothetical protein [Dysgonomonas hofstadii]
MGDILKSYKKQVAEGKTFLIIAIAFAIVVRLVYFFYLDFPGFIQTDAYIWNQFSFIFDTSSISLLASSMVTAGMAVLAAHINTEHVFVRRRTLLPSAFIILLFSCNPAFIYITPEYVGGLLVLYIINLFFTSYNSERKAQASYKVSFMLALGSFFVPVLLLYLPIMWLTLAIARCFNFKSFLVSLLGVFTLYFSAFSFYLFTDSLNVFLSPFTSLSLDTLEGLPFFDFEATQWAILGVSLIMLIIIICDNYINRHKDKIRIRAYLGTLDLLAVMALLFFVFLNLGTQMHLFVALISGSLLLAHFYALVEQRITIWLFYFLLIFYILICFSSFLSL